MEAYDLIFSLIFAFILVITFSLYSSLQNIKKDYKKILLLWSIGFILIFCCSKILVCTNIEFVHFFQYAFLAIILRIVIPDNFSTLWITTYLGILDETINYIWHPQFTKYLDFNDFILNFTGAFLGIITYITFFEPTLINKSKEQLVFKMQKIVCLIGILIAVIFYTGLLTKHIKIYYPVKHNYTVVKKIHNKYVFILSFIKSKNFWSITDYGKKYHILSPIEGSLIFILMFSLTFLAKLKFKKCILRFSI